MDFKEQLIGAWKGILIGIVGLAVIGVLICLFQSDPELAKFAAYLIGGTLLLWQVMASSQRAKAAEETASAMQKTADSTEKGNIAERFKNAIEHLGHESPSVRMGGIYALHHIAQDVKEYRERVFEILCAHIRETTAQKEYKPQERFIPETDVSVIRPHIEIQSILKLLFADSPECDIYTEFTANLEYSNLKGATLGNTNLQHANFEGADLQDANFRGASLREANLEEANLQDADFSDAESEGAYFGGAHLYHANFSDAELQGAHFGEADLQGTHFEGADLQKASFFNANLQGAGLTRAQNLTTEQLLTTKTLYQVKLSDGVKAEIKQRKPKLLEEPKPDNETDA